MKARAVNNGVCISLDQRDQWDENEIWIPVAEAGDLVLDLLRAINSVSPSILSKVMREIEGDL